ncbi:sodium- and chloride-dependent GABA transporter 2-like protein [Dinothrombium tinctorium]|uniref:Sodium-and chloride-dependent GABA transporter 2-like protein n=1 Tax=Dinothrombium tinctorium TaxID=1965070 RepID=A0A3S3RU64_9ACAR|nr:sodium- and chloride-dependent GABA transporter 2-like protein [Dinothrombium tinctorium]
MTGAFLIPYFICLLGGGIPIYFLEVAIGQYWQSGGITISPGIDHPEGLQWQLVVTLGIMWCINFLCICRGIKSTGKAVYVTAIFPYIMMTILFFRGITLPGASNGIIFYLKPDFEKLAEGQVWIDAGTQIFFSYAIALGTMTALGSYNDFHNNFYYQLFFVCGMNTGTSFFAGFAIFSVLGFMAYEQGIADVGAVAEKGPGLAFIAYPKGVAEMPLAPLWAVLFFIMILLLGLGSQFVAVEGFITAVVDMFPRILRVGKRREWFIGFTCFISFIIGLTMVTRGGMYVFQIFDYYGASGMCLLWMCFFECIVIAWFYGSDKFVENIREMIGIKINPWFPFCWKFISPMLTAGVFIFSVVTYKPVTYNSYVYPQWAIAFGWMLALSSMILVPLYFIYRLLTSQGENFNQVNDEKDLIAN